MAAEPIQITSLKRPPENWEVPASRQARLAWLATPPGGVIGKTLYDGPRADAEPTDDLPSFPSDSRHLPSDCQHCGSRLLNREMPLGPHQRGMISCGRCGRQVCWLTASLAERRFDVPAPRLRPIEPRPFGGLPTRQQIMSRFQWLDGCSRACSLLYGHDAASHEAHGREMAHAEAVAARPIGIVRTGPLTVDCDGARALIDGAIVDLSATEMRLLTCLAVHVGRALSHEQITRACWDVATCEAWRRTGAPHGAWHGLRVTIARLRKRLGDAGSLIENRPGHGYLLRAESAADPDPMEAAP